MIDLDLNYLPEMPENKDWQIGCIGAGFIMADCHLVAYRQAGFNPVAIASANPENARRVAKRHDIKTVHETYQELLDDPELDVVDIAVPPDLQIEVIREAVKHGGNLKGILAQKPLGCNYAEAVEAVQLCKQANIKLIVNQNMRYDQSVRAAKDILNRDYLGKPIFATIDMRAIPHWMPWQKRQGWVTLRIMSIHHLDTFRYWFGDPARVYASIRSDPRTSKQFRHEDGICAYILEYANGLRACAWDDVWTGPAREGAESDIGINWRIEGDKGMARGTIGWPDYPARTPSTMDFTTVQQPGYWFQPRWEEVWFPDAFAGPMSELLRAIETDKTVDLNGEDNLKTMALVDACYLSAKEHRAVRIAEITNP